jgi:hypothetical protein
MEEDVVVGVRVERGIELEQIDAGVRELFRARSYSRLSPQ